MMSREEERQLRDIERSLANEDPMFAGRISAFAPSDARGLGMTSTVIMVVGCALALLGLVTGSAFGFLGVLIAIVGFFLRLAASDTGRHTRGDGDDEAGSGHDGALI